jgi:O-antigen/teichoic acid export membrane protein
VVPIAVVLIVLGDLIVDAWVGPKMIAVVPVLQILAVTVALRVGTATSTTLLKGAGQVRYLAIVNIVAGVVNVILSTILIHSFGLTGVAYGTLVPVACASMFVLFPASCRRVQLPLVEGVRRAVWPSLWPAGPMVLALVALRRLPAGSLVLLACEAALASALYVGLFVLAIGARDRNHYLGRLMELTGRRRNLAAA